MTTIEESQIAARLAAASAVFPIRKAEDFDSRADVSAEGNVITITVTDHLGRAKREYRAVIQWVAGGFTMSWSQAKKAKHPRFAKQRPTAPPRDCRECGQRLTAPKTIQRGMCRSCWRVAKVVSA